MIGSVVRVEVIGEAPFTIVNNVMIRDGRLSYGATGLHVDLVSNSASFKLSIEALANRKSDRHGKVKTYLKELQQYGYLQIERPRQSSGRFEPAVWYVFREPQPLNFLETKASSGKPPQVKNSLVVNPLVEKPLEENSSLRSNNTKKHNLKKQQPHEVREIIATELVFPELPQEIKFAINSCFAGVENSLAQLILDQLAVDLPKINNPVAWVRRLIDAGVDPTPAALSLAKKRTQPKRVGTEAKFIPDQKYQAVGEKMFRSRSLGQDQEAQ